MKLEIWTFWLASIFSSDLATISALTDLDRELTLLILPSKINSTHNDDLLDLISYDQDNMQRLYDQRRQTPDFKIDQSYYDPELPKKKLNRNENNATVKIFKTYGKGKAQVKQGQAVHVPNKVGRHPTDHKGYVSVQHFSLSHLQQSMQNPLAAKISFKKENEVKPFRHQRGCRECPTDQTVIATKGNKFVLLPEPCQINPRMWIHHSGPQPGSKIPEGVHVIRGYMGPHKKFCQYQYQVSVRRCEPLKAKEDTIVECSSENSWGSICNISCGIEKEPTGPTELECKENLTWSNPLPKCKGKNDCLTPKVKTSSKISCQTENLTQAEGDFLPNETTCKFMQNEKEVFIICKNGKWRISRKNKITLIKKDKQNSKNKTEQRDQTKHACNPNPCQNGGTCLKPESNKGDPICKCRPQTRGIHCEMRECYYNICENDGLCFFQNEERICYCSSDYSGDTCQQYTPQ